MKTDLEIARAARLKPIEEVISGLSIPGEFIVPYGRFFAKIRSECLEAASDKPQGKLILVTSMSPTPEGEGKTTLTVGLCQSLKLLGKKAAACIRQPSLGPFFGVKGGATGGGYSQVVPPDDITVQFTGDEYAVATAHNLVSSIIDNHIYHGNRLGMDKDRLIWSRVSSINDRALRSIRVASGKDGERAEEFHISAASELMSILCLSRSLAEVRQRAARIITGFGKDGGPVTVKDLEVEGSVAALLRNAIHPNIAQSIEGVPVFVHGGPFGNISLGCSSLIATSLSLRLADYVLTEAGFATDLGAEKFFDIKCRAGGLTPSAALLLATLRSLRYHGGAGDYKKPDREASLRGLDNLRKHIENIKMFGVPVMVVINRYVDDMEDELKIVTDAIRKQGIPVHTADVRERGGQGGIGAAEGLLRLCEQDTDFRYLYPLELPIEEKIARIAKDIYGADGADFTEKAMEDIERARSLGLGDLPVCVAKTHRSLSDDPSLLGRPSGFMVKVSRVRPASGAGFLVALSGQVLLMPGFKAHPRAEHIDVDGHGNIVER